MTIFKLLLFLSLSTFIYDASINDSYSPTGLNAESVRYTFGMLKEVKVFETGTLAISKLLLV